MTGKTKKSKREKTYLKVQIRREQVKDRLMARMKPQQIAKDLGISTRTLERDISEIRKDMDKEVTAKTAMQIFGELLGRMDMRSRRLWAVILDQASNKREVIAAVNSLRDEDRELVRNCQMLGILPIIPVGNEAPSQIQQNNIENTNIYQMVLNIKKAQSKADEEIAQKVKA